jgi:outer membrane protein, multidrug efflux system
VQFTFGATENNLHHFGSGSPRLWPLKHHASFHTYHRPAIQTLPAYRDLSANSQLQAQGASYADLPWWQVFQDATLQELIRSAIKQNYDLQLATERINAARAMLAISRSSLFPQLKGSGNFSGGKDTATQSTFNFLGLTADAAFQLDFFGRLRRASEAARAELLATADARQTVLLTLVSDVASDYFELLQLDLQLQITRETIQTQENSVSSLNSGSTPEWLQSLMCFSLSKSSTLQTPKFQTWSGR